MRKFFTSIALCSLVIVRMVDADAPTFNRAQMHRQCPGVLAVLNVKCPESVHFSLEMRIAAEIKMRLTSRFRETYEKEGIDPPPRLKRWADKMSKMVNSKGL